MAIFPCLKQMPETNDYSEVNKNNKLPLSLLN